MFRLLGLHPGPELGTDTVAALAGASKQEVHCLLDVLVGARGLALEGGRPDHWIVKIHRTGALVGDLSILR
jgi:hypothetical protein